MDSAKQKGVNKMKLQKLANIVARGNGYSIATKITVSKTAKKPHIGERIDSGWRKTTTGEYVPNAYRNNFGWKNTYYQAAKTEVIIPLEVALTCEDFDVDIYAVEQTKKQLSEVTGGITSGRISNLSVLFDILTTEEKAKLRIEECTDEWTGCRYGNAKCRKGKAKNIGSGGRNRGSNYSYQIWAVWN